MEFKGTWTISFAVDENNRVLTTLIEGEVAGASQGEIDTLLIEGAYEIIRQSEQFAASLDRGDKQMVSAYRSRKYNALGPGIVD